MSQYPNQPFPSGPYQPPGAVPYAGGYGYVAADPYAVLLAPARRAGILLIVLGSLGLLCGVCAGIVALSWDQLMSSPEFQAQFQRPEFQQLNATLYGLVAAVMLVASIVVIMLGFVVRRGQRGAVITSLVLVCLAAAYMAFGAVKTIAVMGTHPVALASAGMNFVLVVVLGVSIAWLMQALRNARNLQAMAQQQAQYWQYQQQAQYSAQPPYGNAYGQAGYPPQGYGAAVPPPPPQSGQQDQWPQTGWPPPPPPPPPPQA